MATAANRNMVGPSPEPAGIADLLADYASPVDLPDPPEPLPGGLRWTTEVIVVAALVLALFNAHALRGWAYRLDTNAATVRLVSAAEGWYEATGRFGLNRPVEAVHAGWQSLKDRRFGEEAPRPPP
jgi:hypothetical protein